MSEQFAFEQTGGHGRAVEFYVRAAPSAALFVNGPGDKLFPGAGFALNQDCRVGGRYHPHGVPDFTESVVIADEFVPGSGGIRGEDPDRTSAVTARFGAIR